MGNIIELIVRKQRLWVIIFNICFLFLGILALYNAEYGVKTLNIKIEYGEEYSKENFAQIFYAESEKDMNEEMSCKGGCSDTDSTITVNLTMSEYQKYVFRLDPINISGRCTIKRIVVSDRYGEILDKSGKAISGYIRSVGNVNTKIYKDEFAMYCLTDDPCLVFNSSFNQDIIDSAMRSNLSVFYAITILYIIFGITQIVLTKKNRKYKRKWIIVIRGAISSITLALGGCLLYGENYLTDNFSDVPLGQLLYHLHTPLDGTNTSSFTVVIISIILIIVLSIVIVLAAYWGLEKLHRRDTVFNWISIGGCMASAFAIMMFSFHFDVANYLKYINEESTIYEDEYVDGSDVEITFPSQKRNLIYIFLESMEMTYADTSVGGAMDVNYIPELTTLSLENENFGTYGKLNGAYTVPGATFTMGGLVAQTSGIPINENIVSNDTLNSDWQSENNYVPGVYAIGDVLEQQGYNQEFLIGSNGKFAGRSSYFIGHGDYKIFDYYTAIDRGYIDEDYKVWWGYEDKKLF